MIENTKCQCGHNNPVGTVLCESCGLPVVEETKSAFDMRYDGVARRSQTYQANLLDQIWNFFSSVKVAIYLIIAILIASILGTILPQENQLLPFVNREKFYTNTYGFFGKMYYDTGLYHTFNTWWFTLLLIALGTSLVICSLDRVVPLYKALKKQRPKKHKDFLLRQKVSHTFDFSTAGTDIPQAQTYLTAMEQKLRKKRYKVIREEDALLAEKGRFSRWGPYINHIGLILVLLGVLARSIPGWYMDDLISVMEGDMQKINNTPYFVKNNKFTVEYYQNTDRPLVKLYQTDATLYKCEVNCDTDNPTLKELGNYPITVNHPLEYQGLKLYQFDYQPAKLKSVDVTLSSIGAKQSFGGFNLDFYKPKTAFQVGDYSVKVLQYFPDFDLDQVNGKMVPITKSKKPNNPAFLLQVKGPLTPNGENMFYIPFNKNTGEKINATLGVHYLVEAGDMSKVHFAQTTTLNVRKDTAVPIVFVAGIISMIGLVMGMYWQHRRIWISVEGATVILAAHTNKNWFGLKKEVAHASTQAGLAVTPKQLQNGG